MWHSLGKKQIVNDIFLKYSMDVRKGQSGAPILKGRKKFVIGVHLAYNPIEKKKIGLRIMKKNVGFLL